MIQRMTTKGTDNVTVALRRPEAVLRGHGVDSRRVVVVGDLNDWDPAVAPCVSGVDNSILDLRRNHVARTAR